jgi:hypothetical protein
MTIKTFYHQLSSGENVKFTIQDEFINGARLYCANLINVDLDFYQKLTKPQQDSYLGMFITNGKHSRIYYKDPVKLENDIKEFYGEKWLDSEV